MNEDRIASESFTALSEAIRAGQISPVDLVDCMLDRIARFDGKQYEPAGPVISFEGSTPKF